MRPRGVCERVAFAHEAGSARGSVSQASNEARNVDSRLRYVELRRAEIEIV